MANEGFRILIFVAVCYAIIVKLPRFALRYQRAGSAACLFVLHYLSTNGQRHCRTDFEL